MLAIRKEGVFFFFLKKTKKKREREREEVKERDKKGWRARRWRRREGGPERPAGERGAGPPPALLGAMGRGGWGGPRGRG